MDSERLVIDPSAMGRNGGEGLKETKVPIPKKRMRLLAEFEEEFEGRDGKLVSAYGTVHQFILFINLIIFSWQFTDYWPWFSNLESLQREDLRTQDIHEFAKIESKLRSEHDNEQTEDGMSNSTVAGLAPQELVPIDPVRLDGKNYTIWARRMEFFLKELKVEYVLYEPCPGIMLGSEATTEEIAESKAAEEKWIKDDFMCLRTILNYLCDDLLHRYAKRKKTTTAKQLWDDLKLMFATKRSLVRKYVEFQMVDEKTVVEQVQEFNRIFDDVVASGMTLSEKFHVSAILAKLPASWKYSNIKSLTGKEKAYVDFRSVDG
ncbi:PREDICTED: UBN2_2 domain-containing [Prunus dulcis]|uniref:PREDICTED: UBN2_2 domain-containing n=2 Tax=Prunus dulcis TaxID=3755 RepID=A0A5E4FEE8_PRUDU|nr:PREDICTED: UBN2_2 domain-containing [Prunus dulcis]